MTDALFHVGALYFGWMIGYFGSVACAVWAFALYSVFGEGRSPRHSLLSPPKYPPGVAFKRLLIRMPLLAFAHPFPWVIGGVGYLGYVLLTVPMRSAQLVLGLAALGGFVYGVAKALFAAKS